MPTRTYLKTIFNFIKLYGKIYWLLLCIFYLYFLFGTFCDKIIMEAKSFLIKTEN